MPIPNPLNYSHHASETHVAQRNRRIISGVIVAASIFATPFILWMLYSLNRASGAEYAAAYLITATNPYLALVMTSHLPNYVLWMALFFQIPFYGVLLGLGYLKRRLMIVAVLLCLVHLVAAIIAIYIVRTSGGTPGFYSVRPIQNSSLDQSPLHPAQSGPCLL